ncbi:MAG TPA: type II CAAX endopeptidase family protein [Anaerolineaceae bacterium]|nr:type II CAAX endopeptidase family protein [Anaerolineaceae bacterium]
MHSKSMKKIYTFLALVLILSAIVYYFIFKSGSLHAFGGNLVLLLMWVPGVSGIITQLIFERTLRGMGWKLGKAKYLLIAYFLPVLYCLVVYGITWITGLGSVPNPEFLKEVTSTYGITNTNPAIVILIFSVVASVVGLFGSLVSATGEEIGWRGVLVPELAKVTSFSKVALISGIIWAVWHLPAILFADYNLPGIPKWYAGLMFTIMVLGISFAFAWLRLKSGSLWTAAILHASHNLFVQVIFTPLTLQNKITPFIIDEFGIGLALAGVVVAWFFIRKNNQQPLAV